MINRSYYFILIQSKQIQSKEQWEPNLLEYALKNILSEIFSKNISSPDIVLLNQWTLLIPVPTEQTSKEMIYQTVSEAHSTLVQVFGGNFVSYVTEACELPQIQTKISEGLAILKNQVQNQNVILNEQSSFHYREWSIPTETWYSLLITQNISTLRERVASFLEK